MSRHRQPGMIRAALNAGLSYQAMAVHLAGGVLATALFATPALAQGTSSTAATLPALQVQGERRPDDLPPPYAGGQIAEGGALGILGTRNVLDTPFSTVNFTEKLIEDLQARTAADVLIDDSSVRMTTGANGFDDTFQIRGFQVGAGDTGFNGLYGLIPSNRVIAQYIERIQLLKGPGAFMNGMPPGGSVGGSINIISKRATDDPFIRLTPTLMSSGNYGAAVDANRRFGSNKEWGVRLNGVARNGEASVDGGNWRDWTGALSADYRGERLRWALDAISQNDDTKNFRPQMTLQATIPSLPRVPDARGNWYPGTQLKQRDNTIATFVEYDLTDWLTAYGGIGYRKGTNDQTFPDSRVAGFPSGANQAGNFRLINAYYDSYAKALSGNIGLRSRFNTGPVKHALNVVYTGYQQENGNAYLANTPAQSLPSNLYNPTPLQPVPGVRQDPRKASVNTLTSYAIADTLSFFNERVFFTAGVRQQNVKQQGYSTVTGAKTTKYDASATTPLFGLVVKPWENVSLYANYAEGLSQGTIVGAGFANAGETLAPFKSDQQEIGVKVDWGRIMTSAALFQISRPSLITTTSNAQAYDGEQRNRGLELAAYGEILTGLRAMGSMTFLKPELSKNPNPAIQGNDAAGQPNFTASASLDWDLPWVRGLSTNGRVIYTGGSYLTTANTVKFPSWTRLDLGLRYETSIQNNPVTFRFNVENVFDKQYWLTTGTFVTVASPRTFIGSATIQF